MKVAIVNKNQASYYKDLYASLADDLDVLYVTYNKHCENYKKAVFDRRVVIPVRDRLSLKEVDFTSKGALKGNASYYNQLVEFQPDIVVCHEMAPFNFQAFIYAWINQCPVVISTELGFPNIRHFPLRSRLFRKLLKPFTFGVIAHSPDAMQSDLVENEFVARSFHASAVDESAAESFKTDQIMSLCFLGRIIERKGLDLFLKSLKQFKEEGGGCIFRVIGRGEIPWLNDLIKENQLEKEVVYEGFLEGEEKLKVLKESDVFVLPSRFDTYGAVTHEAASCGCALLISEYAGSSMMVDDTCGGVIDPYNIEDTVIQLWRLSDSQIREECKRNAFKVSVEYSAQTNAKNIISLLKKLVN